MSEFSGATPTGKVDATKATARLPGLDIEIVHRRSPDGNAEQITISLQAVPSFEAFGRALAAGNPYAFWAEASRLAWLSWLQAARAMMLPAAFVLPPPEPRSKAVERRA